MWTPLHSQKRAAAFVVAALGIAFAVDWFLVPWSYPIAALYVVSFLIAALAFKPRVVTVVGAVAWLLSTVTTLMQGAPLGALASASVSLIGTAFSAVLLARQREAAAQRRQEVERAQGRLERLIQQVKVPRGGKPFAPNSARSNPD